MNQEWLWNLTDSIRYLSMLKQRFFSLCPYRKKELKKLLRQTLRITGIGTIFAVLIVFFWNRCFEKTTTLYLIGSLIFAVYLTTMEIPAYLLQKKEGELYQELISYLAKVKHTYLSHRHIPNAILMAADRSSYEMQCLAGQLHQILMEGDRKERVRDFVLYNPTNRYLKLFLVQAYEASEMGDMETEEGSSLFSDNVEYLRVEVMEELYRRKRRAYEFAGYTFVTAAPVFFMPILKRWGLDFAPELDYFYAGTGQLLELLTFCVSFVIYGFINRAKEITMFVKRVESENQLFYQFCELPVLQRLIRWLEKREDNVSQKIRELLLQSGEKCSFAKLWIKMISISIGTLLTMVSVIFAVHAMERQTILEDVSRIESIAPYMNTQQKEQLKQQILMQVKKYKEQQNLSKEQIKVQLQKEWNLNYTMEQAVLEEILTKLEQYHASKVTGMELLFCLGISLLAGFLPLFKLWYQVQTSFSGALYEVRQFQSVAIMERKLHGITILGMLEDMEAFSGLFKGVLRRCINAYSAGPTKALQTMKEEGGKLHSSFAELADSFLAVEETGITLAFAEVENNRKLLEKMSQLETEISIEKKKDSTDLLSKVPMLLAVGAYFVIPFFGYSLQGVYEIFTVLEELQK